MFPTACADPSIKHPSGFLRIRPQCQSQSCWINILTVWGSLWLQLSLREIRKPSPHRQLKIALRWRHAPDCKKRCIRPQGMVGKTCVKIQHLLYLQCDTWCKNYTRLHKSEYSNAKDDFSKLEIKLRLLEYNVKILITCSFTISHFFFLFSLGML